MLSPGSRLGKYELIRRLAVGGMAEIYLARATGIEGFEKLVVLKRILPQHAANEDFIRMFLDEARLAATLHHPNIAQVYDIGMVGGSYFFTMEYVHGEDLRSLLKAARRSNLGLPLEHAISVILGIAAGLHHAHEKLGPDGRPLGIVHRDVSPSNILITYDGCVKVVDFGIAKAASRQAETRAGTLKGKIAYMSPEQCRGERLDRRSDVFAIGILLYELTTGARLFDGDNEFAIMNQIVYRDAPRPSVRRQGYPLDLEQIALRSLRRNREERYVTAQELQVDLENFAREHKLAVSAVSLQRFMEELFGRKLEAFRQAQRQGGSLVDHVTQSLVIDDDGSQKAARARGSDAARRPEGSISTPADGGELPDAADSTNPSVPAFDAAPAAPAALDDEAPPRRGLKVFAIGAGVAALGVTIAVIVALSGGGGKDDDDASREGNATVEKSSPGTPTTGVTPGGDAPDAAPALVDPSGTAPTHPGKPPTPHVPGASAPDAGARVVTPPKPPRDQTTPPKPNNTTKPPKGNDVKPPKGNDVKPLPPKPKCDPDSPLPPSGGCIKG